MAAGVGRIADFLFEIASLRRITRSHRQLLPNVTDNIADHSFRVALIGMILSETEKVDGDRVVRMCLIHDLPEARTGDANWINRQYSELDETGALRDQMEGLPIAGEALRLAREYGSRKSPESLVAKDADLLDQMVLQQEYLRSDPPNLKRWQDHTQKALKTRSAKRIAAEIRKADPLGWLYRIPAKTGGRKKQLFKPERGTNRRGPVAQHG